MTGRRFVRALIAAALVAGSIITPAAAITRPAGHGVIDPLVSDAAGDVSALVHVRAGVPFGTALATARAAGARVGTTYEMIRVFVAVGPAVAFERIVASGLVEYVEANRRLSYHTNTSHTATRGKALLAGGVTLADGTPIDGRGVGVAIVDSGVDGTHPDLAGRMGSNVRIYCAAPGMLVLHNAHGASECRGPKTVTSSTDTDTIAAGGHGTYLAGIVAGTGAASAGAFHGAAPGATVHGVGIGTGPAIENALDGLRWVIENRDTVSPPIRVVLTAWGIGPYPADEANNMYGGITKMQNVVVAEGLTLVVSAGNDGPGGTSGQCATPTPGVVCVANYDDAQTGTRDGTIHPTSSRGGDDAQTWPDLSAPGTRIVSTCRYSLPACWRDGTQQSDRTNVYSERSGTSAAAAHVAGIAAQLYQLDSKLAPRDVENLLEDSAYKFSSSVPYRTDPFNRDSKSSSDKGHGLVDALAAAAAVRFPVHIAEPLAGSTVSGDVIVHGTASYGEQVSLFVDGEPVGLAEGAHPRWFFELDTAAIGPGDHVITASLSSSGRTLGIVDRPVTVAP